jgi:serine O-acetyltransferase
MAIDHRDGGYYLPSNLPYHIWKVAHSLYLWHVPFLPFALQQFMRVFLCCRLPYKTQLGKNVHFANNGLAIVVHPNCVIGDNVMIHTHVTLSASRVGNNVQIFVGARIVNMVTLGNYVKVGANAVVLCDVPDNCTAVGVPARIVRRRLDQPELSI